eukprot:gene3043-3324_t
MASKVAVVSGYGVGISAAVAKRLGSQGYKLALLSRTQSRLDNAVSELSKAGVAAKGYSVDLSNASAVKPVMTAIHDDLGPINILFWNPVNTAEHFMTVTPEQLQMGYNTCVTGLVVAVQAAHADLKATKGAVLVTGGGLESESDDWTQMAVDWGAASTAIVKAAGRKLVHILHKGLAADGIYVGEVMVTSTVKGTTWDTAGSATLLPEDVADKFVELLDQRAPNVWCVTV